MTHWTRHDRPDRLPRAEARALIERVKAKIVGTRSFHYLGAVAFETPALIAALEAALERESFTGGDWIREQVAFYDYIFMKASEMCAECFKGVSIEEISAGFKDGEQLYERTIEAIAKRWPTFADAWSDFQGATARREETKS